MLRNLYIGQKGKKDDFSFGILGWKESMGRLPFFRSCKIQRYNKTDLRLGI